MLVPHFVSTNQQPGFYIIGASIVSIQSMHKTSKLIIAKIYDNNTMLPGKRPSMIMLASEICKFTQNSRSVPTTY